MYKYYLQSVIIPVYNTVKWLDECLEAVYNQDFEGKFEVSIYNDSSTDGSLDLIRKWEKQFAEKSIDVVIGGHTSESPRGVGYAKNQAVQQCRGTYLSFLDADDVMHVSRIRKQYQAALAHPQAIIGSNFHRLPTGSTNRYTHWANTLTNQQLYTQIYTSHGPSLIMPTWFCHRKVFEKVQGFDEGGKGVPEDLIFFFRHLELGGDLYRVEEDLLMYRYHTEATSFSIHQDTIWNIRMKYIQKNVIDSWLTFTIWNAGKQGKKFYKSLSPENQKKVWCLILLNVVVK
ncbi:hypothetical protein FSP39_009808 [Pinctada imbricata]|uniref:Glycosyltransferase 2-like domain-containing protein n=1 Tax=Pinctada imbricata TaxID=66713 RepID=A0AA88XR32_PINIB|nr:hypothetical protein FSP39_009808 [Pinctada imbricata]